jgi:hypothetical protein
MFDEASAAIIMFAGWKLLQLIQLAFDWPVFN